MALFFSILLFLSAKSSALQCDNVEKKLSVDWDGDFRAYTCTDQVWPSNPTVRSKPTKLDIDPATDHVDHICLEDRIEYAETIPSRGPHRPNWAVYGEYLFLPVQRWLHNLEHGAIVMLYHPCADGREVNKLRDLVTSCLFRHVITPFMNLTRERPLALIAWASKLEFNTVNRSEIIDFIINNARHGPEDLSKHGAFSQFLLKEAFIVSDSDDNRLCPRRRRKREPATYYDKIYLKLLMGTDRLNDRLLTVCPLSEPGAFLSGYCLPSSDNGQTVRSRSFNRSVPISTSSSCRCTMDRNSPTMSSLRPP